MPCVRVWVGWVDGVSGWCQCEVSVCEVARNELELGDRARTVGGVVVDGSPLVMMEAGGRWVGRSTGLHEQKARASTAPPPLPHRDCLLLLFFLMDDERSRHVPCPRRFPHKRPSKKGVPVSPRSSICTRLGIDRTHQEAKCHLSQAKGLKHRLEKLLKKFSEFFSISFFRTLSIQAN